jgi:hypothetical protein
MAKAPKNGNGQQGLMKDPGEAPCPESTARSASGILEEAFPKHSSSGFEWKTRAGLFHIPLICISYGRDVQGKIRVARGFLAVGQIAVGGIAIGPFAVGIMSIGLFSIGVLALGVLSFSLLLAVGQIACGTLAIGQVVVGLYGLGQTGWAKYLWSQSRTDMEAVAIFYTIKMMILHEGGVTFSEVIVGGLEWGKVWLLSIFK